MLKEKWIEYLADTVPKGKYEIIKILQDCDGTSITLESEKTK